MKTKYLFYSLAMAAAFSACTQEELVNAPAQDADELASRPVAGVVTFVGDEVESRYNKEAGTFQKGDQMGIYLMDSFDKTGEANDANYTYWDWQSHWWKMYTMEDYISTNYGYVYDGNGNWVNRASQLNEGNYIAMFPQNTRATNRRDLWHPIKSNVDLVAHSTEKRYYVGRDNQFFVGYEQIKRDENAEDANGNLEAKVSMKPILTYGKMWFQNTSNVPFKLKKVVFKDEENGMLPNVAYVRPSDIVKSEADAKTELEKSWTNITKSGMEGLSAPVWAWNNLSKMGKNVYDCGYKAQGVYDRTTFSHAAARGMVVYESTTNESYIPYGMTAEESAPVYEYVFKFPGEGVELAGNNSPDLDLTYAGISIALPAFDSWQDMKVEVHVDMYDVIKKTWIPGIVKKQEHESGEFNLEELALWDGDKMSALPEVSFSIDNDYFTPVSAFEVSSSKDFYDLVKGALTNNDTSIPVVLNVTPTGYGIVVGNDVVKLIDDYRAKNGEDKLTITFHGGADVTLAAENSIHKFGYSAANVILAANQTVKGDVTGIATLRNESTATLNVAMGNLATTVNNEGTMIVTCTSTEDGWKYASVTTVNNWNSLTLNNSGTVATVNNKPAAKMTVSGTASIVTTLKNEKNHDCAGNCVVAELTVAGKLTVGTMVNDAKVVVAKNAELKVNTSLTNNWYGHMTKEFIDVFGKVDVASGATFTNKGILNIGNAGGEKGTVNVLTNEAYVYLYGGKIAGLDNEEDAELHVYSESVDVQSVRNSNGEIYFEGVAPQGVGTLGQDNRIYVTKKDLTSKELNNIQMATGFRNLWVYNNITITKDADKNHEWSLANRRLIENIVVKKQDAVKEIYLKAENMTGYNVGFENAKLTVEETMTLHVENCLAVTVKEYVGAVHAGTNSSVNGQYSDPAIDHNQITVTTAAELTTAIAKVSEGGIVRLNDDITLNERLEIAADRNFTLDLNGKTLTGNEDVQYIIVNWGKLKLVNGTVEGSTHVFSPCFYNYGEAEINCTMISSNSNAIQNNKNGKITINGGHYESKNPTGQALRVGDYTDGNAGAWEVYINGGTFIGPWAGLYIANNYQGLSTAGKAVIKNATFRGNANVDDGSVAGDKNYRGSDIVFDRVKNVTIENCTLETETIHSETARYSEINGKEVWTINPLFNHLFGE